MNTNSKITNINWNMLTPKLQHKTLSSISKIPSSSLLQACSQFSLLHVTGIEDADMQTDKYLAALLAVLLGRDRLNKK